MDYVSSCGYSCITEPEWFEEVKDNGWSNFFQCQRSEAQSCDFNIIFGKSLSMCCCPLGNHVIRSSHGSWDEEMTNLKIALIASGDKEIRECFSRLLEQIGVACIFESRGTKALVRILQVDLKLVIVDMVSISGNGVNFLKVIKSLRPRLPIIAIAGDSSEGVRDCLLDAGAMYCLVKPVEEKTLKSIVSILAEEER